MSTEISEKLRQCSFRAMIPFHVLLDDSLTGRQKALYGIIEQMESSHAATPYFSYQWIADLFGISRRGAISLANGLKDKGYIKHSQLPSGKWVWATHKNHPVCSDQTSNDAGSTGDPQGHPPSEAPLHPPSEAPLHPPSEAPLHPNIPETKIPKNKRESAREKKCVYEYDYNPHNLTPNDIRDYIDQLKERGQRPPTEKQWNMLQEQILSIVKLGVKVSDIFDLIKSRGWLSVRSDWNEVKRLIESTKKPNKRAPKKGDPGWIAQLQFKAEEILSKKGILRYDDKYKQLLQEQMTMLA